MWAKKDAKGSYADFVKYGNKVGQIQSLGYMPTVRFEDGSVHSIPKYNLTDFNATKLQQQRIREKTPFLDGRDNVADCDNCGTPLNMHNTVLAGGGVRSCLKCESKRGKK